jgi:hypothetical protein
LEARLEEQAQCILVIIGATPEGRKELVGFTDGIRESYATRALNSALCCFLLMPTSHAPLDRSAFSLSRCPKIRSRRTGQAARQILRKKSGAAG